MMIRSYNLIFQVAEVDNANNKIEMNQGQGRSAQKLHHNIEHGITVYKSNKQSIFGLIYSTSYIKDKYCIQTVVTFEGFVSCFINFQLLV